MSITARRKPWQTSAYMRMADVTHGAGVVRVRFEDGDEASVEVERLLSVPSPIARWDEMTWGPLEIVVPLRGETADAVIPWSAIRELSDPLYGAHLAQIAQREARSLGRRLATLRRARRLSREELAQRADIALDDLARIERGQVDVAISALAPILAAMGCSRRDIDPVRRDGLHRAMLHDGTEQRRDGRPVVMSGAQPVKRG